MLCLKNRPFWVTSTPNDDDIREVIPLWPNSPTVEPLCVPLDKCLTVSIQVIELDTGAEFPPFSILYENVNYNFLGPFPARSPGQEKRLDFYVQVGASCEVTCDENQVLLEIEALTAESSHYDWQVIDDLTNEVVHSCPADTNWSQDGWFRSSCYWYPYSWFRDRVCVPKDGCYRLVAGQSRAEDNFYTTFRGTFQVAVDGEVLLQTESFRFESLRLQHHESPNTCSSNTNICQQLEAEPSLVDMEVFIFEEPLADVNVTLTWNANYYGSEGLVSYQGIFSSDDRPLQYNRICVPDCAIFNHQFSSEVIGFLPTFQVQVDGIIYAEDYQTGSDGIVGGSCQAWEYCREGGQSLVQVGIRYQPPLPLSLDDAVDNWYIVDADGVEKPVFKGGSNFRLYDEWIGLGRRYPSMQPGKHYRRHVCLSDQYFQEGPNAGCTILDMRLEDEQAMETYSYDVAVNGVFFNDRIDCSKKVSGRDRSLCKWLDFVSPGDSRHIILTPLNGNCKTNHSIKTNHRTRYIAAGTVLGFLLMVASLSYYWINRRRATASKKNKNDNASTDARKVDGTSSAPGVIEETVAAHGNNTAVATN